MKKQRLSLWYLVFPLLTLVLIWPPISELPPLRIPENLNWLQIVLVIPFYLGLAAAPGYIYAWLGNYDRRNLSTSERLWVGASLWAALLASLGGLVTIVAVVPFPAVVGSLVMTVLLLRRFYGRPARKEPAVR